MQEQLNEEIRCREWVIRIFPNDDSALHLIRPRAEIGKLENAKVFYENFSKTGDEVAKLLASDDGYFFPISLGSVDVSHW